MANAPSPVNGHHAQQLSLDHHQLAAMLTIELLLSQMHTAANQLGSFVGNKEAADIVVHCSQVLGRDYGAMRERWSKVVQLATPAALSVIDSKKVG